MRPRKKTLNTSCSFVSFINIRNKKMKSWTHPESLFQKTQEPPTLLPLYSPPFPPCYLTTIPPFPTCYLITLPPLGPSTSLSSHLFHLTTSLLSHAFPILPVYYPVTFIPSRLTILQLFSAHHIPNDKQITQKQQPSSTRQKAQTQMTNSQAVTLEIQLLRCPLPVLAFSRSNEHDNKHEKQTNVILWQLLSCKVPVLAIQT